MKNALNLPKHLERYAVDQDYSRYTPVDQATWRHIMRQLRSFLSVHAHPCYLEGLAKTGIEVDRIPRIDVMNEKLEKFGWRAMPVSGFIPPAAFMELQSLGVLPIASDMRSVDHLLYTPAPDIVHEAAGHAPILVDPDFAAYLKAYAQVARKAILSREDINQYEAIRILSDTKEDPSSTPAQVQDAEAKLNHVNAAMKDVSEGALLGRMNWWTAEYGLIGDLKSPKIFGAGLLSSVGESRSAISAAVKKIPLTIECIDYAYDITEQQPQLFVVPKFENLNDVLEELANRMAFRTGGLHGLERARRAETVNTVELDSGLQISGMLKNVRTQNGNAIYLSFEGPTQLAFDGNELSGQGIDQHHHGFGTPLGRAAMEHGGRRSSVLDLALAPRTELERAGLQTGESLTLHFESGVVVTGVVEKLTFARPENGPERLVVLTLTQARATHGQDLLFDPSWGVYDMAIGTKVVSVYGGPADRSRFGETEDFTKKIIPRRAYPDAVLKKHELYSQTRALRELMSKGEVLKAEIEKSLSELIARASKSVAHDWLIHTDLLEIAESLKVQTLIESVEKRLKSIASTDETAAAHIADARKTHHS